MLVVPFLLLALAGLFSWGWLGWLDTEISVEILESRSEVLTSFFVGVTELGGGTFSVLFIGLVSAVLFFKWNSWQLAVWYLFTVAGGAGGLNQLFKFLFQRPRPTVEHLVIQGGYSFPSGHSMGSVIIYGALVFLIVRFSGNRRLKWLSFSLASMLILLIGLSRIYLGVHFPSDVIGGFSLGAAWLSGCIALFGRWEVRQNS